MFCYTITFVSSYFFIFKEKLAIVITRSLCMSMVSVRSYMLRLRPKSLDKCPVMNFYVSFNFKVPSVKCHVSGKNATARIVLTTEVRRLVNMQPAGQGARSRCHSNLRRGGGRRKLNIHRRDKLTAVVVDGHVWSHQQ